MALALWPSRMPMHGSSGAMLRGRERPGPSRVPLDSGSPCNRSSALGQLRVPAAGCSLLAVALLAQLLQLLPVVAAAAAAAPLARLLLVLQCPKDLQQLQ